MRAFAAILLVAACSRAGGNQDLDLALQCAVAHIAADAPSNPDLVPTITDTMHSVATRPIALRALHRLEHALTSAPDVAHVAFALADEGDLAGARAAADRALALAKAAKSDAERDNAIGFAALALAWSGDPARAEQAAAGNPMSLLAVAEGAARGGNKSAAEHAYAAALASPPPAGDLAMPFHVEQIAVLAWLGRIPEAQQQLAAITDPVWHMYAASQLARNAMFAHAPEARALLQAAVDESAHLAADPNADRTSLFAFRSQLAIELDEFGDHAGAAAQRTALATDIAPTDVDRLALLAVYAEYAHASAEADAIVNRLGNQTPPDTRAILAALRGHFAESLGQLALVGPDLRDEAQMIVWQLLAAKPDAGLAAQLRTTACGK